MSPARRAPGKGNGPKTQFLQIRVSSEDRDRIRKAADAEYLEASTWARQAILRAVEAYEREKAPPALKVAEPKPKGR